MKRLTLAACSLVALVAGCAAPPPASPAPPTDPPAAVAPLAPWEPPKLDAARRAKFDRLVPALDKLFADGLRTSRAPGMAVAIVLGGETVYAKGFGVRDAEHGTPFDADTPFPIASVTKGFTAMAVLALRDQGKLSLDDPAARHYPPLARLAYPTRDAPQVTVRHLLTHASGMPEDNEWADVTDDLREPDLARLLDGAALSRVPGVHYEYSNVGWAVLGRIVERVSGMPARDFIRRAIVAPLGMTRTSFEAKDFAPGAIAVGYRGREGDHDMDAPRVVAPLGEPGVMDTAGGILTTARDLARYVSFQVGAWPPRDDPEAGPLRRSSVREMQQGMRGFWYSEILGLLVRRSPVPVAGSYDGHTAFVAPAYGFGLVARTTCTDDHQVDHSGGLPGYSTFMTMLPEKGFGIVLFLNDERAHTGAANEAMKLLRAEGLLVEARPAPAPALAAAPKALHDLVAHWDDQAARSTFAPSFFRYQTIETLAARFARLSREHGACRPGGAPSFVNRLRGSWREACERGSITFAVAVAPGAGAGLQGMEIGEDLPPTAALARAGSAVVELLDHADAAATTKLTAPADTAKVSATLSRLHRVYGDYKLDRAVESDGKETAVFALACAEGPLELTVTLDAGGAVTSVRGHPPRDPSSPNCAD
jgi:CubicO group peptidase (beta-lactamase class C family)